MASVAFHLAASGSTGRSWLRCHLLRDVILTTLVRSRFPRPHNFLLHRPPCFLLALTTISKCHVDFFICCILSVYITVCLPRCHVSHYLSRCQDCPWPKAGTGKYLSSPHPHLRLPVEYEATQTDKKSSSEAVRYPTHFPILLPLCSH